MIDAKEEAIRKFADIVGSTVASAVVEALRARPPIAVLPEPVVQALMQLAAKATVAGPVVPVPPWQQQPQAISGAREFPVVRFNEHGAQYVSLASIPQLLAELCDLAQDQNALLEEATAPSKTRRRRRAG